MNNLTDTDDVPQLVREVLRDLGLRRDAELHGGIMRRKAQMIEDGLEFLCLLNDGKEIHPPLLAVYCGCTERNARYLVEGVLTKLRRSLKKQKLHAFSDC